MIYTFSDCMKYAIIVSAVLLVVLVVFGLAM